MKLATLWLAVLSLLSCWSATAADVLTTVDDLAATLPDTPVVIAVLTNDAVSTSNATAILRVTQPLHGRVIRNFALTSHAELTPLFRFAAAQLSNTVVQVAITNLYPWYMTNGAWKSIPTNTLTEPDRNWIGGFFPGSLWMIYEYTGDTNFSNWAQMWQAALAPEQYSTAKDDVSFIINCSFGNGYRITGDPDYKDILTQTCRSFTNRWNSIVGCLADDQLLTPPPFEVIIDTMMNTEIFCRPDLDLDTNMLAMAISHAGRTLTNHLRADGSTFMRVIYDGVTNGSVLLKDNRVPVGVLDTWARGQSWATHSFPLLYRYTGDGRFLATAKKLADFYINNAPADYVPYWYYRSNGVQNDLLRDSSAAAVTLAGLLELSQQVTNDADGAKYWLAAHNLFVFLSSTNYLAISTTNAILLHGNPVDANTDTSLIYGDYYFVESLKRFNEIFSRTTLTYIPATNFIGTDTFTYQACESSGAVSTATVTVAVNPKALTVAGIAVNSKVYDGTTSATLIVSNPLLVGVLSSDMVTLNTTNAVGAWEDKNVGTGKLVTVSGLTLLGADTSKYTLTQPTINGDITMASLTVTGITASDRGYDGTTDATLTVSNAVLVGVISGDDAVLKTADATGAFTDPNVGTNKTVLISGLTLSGADAGNYKPTPLSVNASITPADSMVTAWPTATAISYGQTLAASTLSGGSATPPGSFTFTAPSSVPAFGTVPQSVTYTPTDTVDYKTASGFVSVTVNPKELTVAGISANNKAYDGTTNATLILSNAVLVGVLNGDTVTLNTINAVGVFGDKNLGANKLVTVSGLTLLGADAVKYKLTQPTINADITPASLMVRGITASSKVYDGTTSATLVVSNPLLLGVTSGDVVTLNTTNAVGAFVDKNVGTGKLVTVSGLTLLGADAGKYTLTQPTINADITPASLTVTGITVSDKVYDGTTTAMLNTNNGALNTVISGDAVTLNAAVATGAFTDPIVGTNKTVSVSGLALSGADAGNYNLTPLSLNASITPADSMVTAWPTATAITYGQTLAASTLSGGSATPPGSFSFTAPSSVPAFGTAPQSVTYTPTDTVDYTAASGFVSLNVNPKALTVAGIDANSKAYDGTTNATLVVSNALLVGVIGGDSVTLNTTNAVAAFVDKRAGAGKLVTVSGLALLGTDAGNYTLTPPATSADITLASLTVTDITAVSKVYDGTTNVALTVSNALLVGVISGDDVALNTPGATGSFIDPNATTNKTVLVSGLILDGEDAGNYDLTQPTITGSITPANSATALLSSQNPSVRGSNVTFMATVTPMPPGSTTPTGSVQFYANGTALGSPVALTAGVASLNTTDLPVGTNTVTGSYLGDGNFFGSGNSLSQVVRVVPATPVTIVTHDNGDGTVTLTFTGTPGVQYALQASDNLVIPAWANISTNTAGADGHWSFTESTSSHSIRFYRSSKQ